LFKGTLDLKSLHGRFTAVPLSPEVNLKWLKYGRYSVFKNLLSLNFPSFASCYNPQGTFIENPHCTEQGLKGTTHTTLYVEAHLKLRRQNLNPPPPPIDAALLLNFNIEPVNSVE